MHGIKIGYDSFGRDLAAPGDRRRFAGFANRNGICLVDPHTSDDSLACSVLTLGGDLSLWSDLKKHHPPVILDIVDAYLHEPKLSPRRYLRGIYKTAKRDFKKPILSYTKLLNMIISSADAVVCASEEQREFLSDLNPNTHAIVDCFDELMVDQPVPAQNTSKVNLLWEGFPENLKHFEVIADSLTTLSAQYEINLSIVTQVDQIGRRRRALEEFLEMTSKWNINVKVQQWSIEVLRQESATATMAVIPIDAGNQMAWMKSENKLLGFWSLGIPVMASATPSYSRIGTLAQATFVTTENHDWYNALDAMFSSQRHRNDNAVAGFALAETLCRGSRIDERWNHVLESIDVKSS